MTQRIRTKLRAGLRFLLTTGIAAMLLLSLTVYAQAAGSAKQKYVSVDDTMKLLDRLGVTKGNPLTYVKSSDTGEKEWRAHLFTLNQGGVNLPLITYVNKSDVVVGLLIRNGKLVIPKIPVEEMMPAMNMSQSKVTSEGRISFNPAGKETIYMFTDPDCPYCQPIEKLLASYKGKYKVVLKHFPLEQIHPGAKERALEKQCMAMSSGCDDKSRQVAAAIVDEDMKEASALGVDGTPFFITDKGKVIAQIPDLGAQ
ncbi:MAG: DsbA family protein [Thermodesulfovibrionales bacterium]